MRFVPSTDTAHGIAHKHRGGTVLVAIALLLAAITFGCVPSDGASDAVSHEEMIIGGCSPEYVEGELVGTAWLGDGLIISVKEADGVVSDFLVGDRPEKQERLAKAPMGTWVELIYFPDEQCSVPVVDSITIYDS